jgi:predicted outer membrane repeat protein
MIMILLLLVSTAGVATRFFFLLPPDPRIVTNLLDDGIGSLRWAIDNAPARSTITFDPSLGKSVILLTSNDLTFIKPMTIRGPVAHTLAISGGKSGFIVHVLPGVTVAIFNLSFINSNTGRRGFGFIENEGTLTLTHSNVSGNRSSYLGGGIYNNGGNLILDNSTVLRNSAPVGGGIYNDTMSELMLLHSTISENVASDAGGGIYDFETSAHQSIIISCTISGNTAMHHGGGIFVQGSYSLETRNSHITGNHAPAYPDIEGKIVQSH